MIYVCFPLDGKTKGDCVGGIALEEKSPKLKLSNGDCLKIWMVYKVHFITEKTVLFAKNDGEFCTTNGTYNHEMGKITIEIITGPLKDKWLCVKVEEKKSN